MYSFSYLELVCCSMSSSNCCFLACTHTYTHLYISGWSSSNEKTIHSWPPIWLIQEETSKETLFLLNFRWFQWYNLNINKQSYKYQHYWRLIAFRTLNWESSNLWRKKNKKLFLQGISFIQRLGRHDSYFSHAEEYISTFPYAQAQVVTLEVLMVIGGRSILPGELASDSGVGVEIQFLGLGVGGLDPSNIGLLLIQIIFSPLLTGFFCFSFHTLKLSSCPSFEMSSLHP